jgi:hypothetical protein
MDQYFCHQLCDVMLNKNCLVKRVNFQAKCESLLVLTLLSDSHEKQKQKRPELAALDKP